MRTIKGMTDERRLGIINEYLSGKSKYSLRKKYKLTDSNCIDRWLRIFGIEDKTEPSPTNPFMTSNPDESQVVSDLKLQLKELKSQLAYAQMKAKAYDTMIDVAEEQFNIAIRKKAGTKQS